MSEETMAAVGVRLAADDKLREAVGGAASPEDIVRILAAEGFAVSTGDVERGSAPKELTDSDLDAVSGGGFATYGCNTPTQYFVFTHCYP